MVDEAVEGALLLVSSRMREDGVAVERTGEARVSALMAPVPEPATWAMLLAGVGLVGALGRRRQRV